MNWHLHYRVMSPSHSYKVHNGDVLCLSALELIENTTYYILVTEINTYIMRSFEDSW